MKRKHSGLSYAKRVADVNAIYEQHARSGLSNREIWRRYIYPIYAISERTFYNMLNAPGRVLRDLDSEGFAGFLFPELLGSPDGGPCGRSCARPSGEPSGTVTFKKAEP